MYDVGIHFNRGFLHADGRSLGPEASPSFVVEFTDFFCEHCHRAHWEMMEPAMAKYLSTGKLRVESHPVAFLHDDSMRAAIAVLCAQEQHKYWEVRHMLFQVPLDNKNGGNVEKGTIFSGKLLRKIAEVAGLDLESFIQCFAGQRHREEVETLTKLAMKMGAHAAPSFFLGPSMEMVEGFIPYDRFIRKLHLHDHE